MIRYTANTVEAAANRIAPMCLFATFPHTFGQICNSRKQRLRRTHERPVIDAVVCIDGPHWVMLVIKCPLETLFVMRAAKNDFRKIGASLPPRSTHQNHLFT